MKIPMVGKRFGKLVVIKEAAPAKTGEMMWICECDCGAVTMPMRGSHLRGGRSQSCGCRQREIVTKRGRDCPPTPTITHHESYTRLYRIWQAMKSRCGNPKSSNYKNYGQRGIEVCEDWRNSYEAFRDWAMANGYTDKLTIDRKDNYKGYSPDNCRWATYKEQSNNKRTKNGE